MTFPEVPPVLTTFLHYSIAGAEFESLTHKTTESIKSSRDSGLGIDFNEDVLLGVDINLQEPGPVQGAVHEHQETLKVKSSR